MKKPVNAENAANRAELGLTYGSILSSSGVEGGKS